MKSFALGSLVALGAVSTAFAQSGSVTYSNSIANLLKQNCTSCHSSENSVGGFSISNYEDAKARASDIVREVRSTRMPHGITARVECSPPGTFVGPSRWTGSQLSAFEQWMASGMPAGDMDHVQLDVPAPLNEKPLGEPDLVLQNSDDGYEVPAGSPDGSSVPNIIRNFILKLPLQEDRYIVAVEILPDGGSQDPKSGFRRIVHHAHLMYDEKNQSQDVYDRFHREHPEDQQAGFTDDGSIPKVILGPWFPGAGPTRYPDGVGHLIKAGSSLLLQVHYALYNKAPFRDRTQVRVWLAHEPIRKQRKSAIIKNESFTIPAGDRGFVVEAKKKFDSAITIYSMLPHMHQLGTDFRVTAIKPDGSESCMVDVDWDFNHQNQFLFAKPMSLPAGTTIALRAQYDNSQFNPNQFNPVPKDIPWGEAADREMMLSMFAYSLDAQELKPASPQLESAERKRKQLTVKGQGFAPGALIEVDGRFALDTQVGQDGSLVSETAGKGLKRGSRAVVVNPDGGRSNEIPIR